LATLQAQNTYLLRLDEVPKSKDAANYERLGRSPFYVLKSAFPPSAKYSENSQYQLMAWYNTAIQSEKAHSISTGNSDQIIGIIDSGTELRHAAFLQNLWINSAEDINQNGQLDSLDLNGIDDDGNGYIDDVIGYDFVDTQNRESGFDFGVADPFPQDEFSNTGHGALVHSIIRELAPSARIMSLRAADANGLLEEDDIARAIIYAVENGAKIINMSFGNGTYSAFLEDVINYAASFGVICVGASGNAGAAEIIYPARYSNVIAVGNSNEFDERNPSSNYGDQLDLLAPGTNIVSRGLLGQLFQVSGTSFSAPMVSATLALVLDRNPTMSFDQLRSHLRLSSKDVGASGYDEFTGAGRLDMFRAVSEFSRNTLQIVSPQHQAAYNQASLPVVLLANGTHIRDLDITIESATAVVYSENFFSQFFLNDTVSILDLTGLPDGNYTATLNSNLFNGNRLESQSKFYIDRQAPPISALESGVLQTPADRQSYVEAESSEPVKFTIQNAANVVLASRLGFDTSIYSAFESLGDSVTVQLIDRAANKAAIKIKPTAREVWSPSLSFSNQLALKKRAWISSVTSDLNGNGLTEFWVSTYKDGSSQLIDSLFVLEWTGSSAHVLHKRANASIMRDAQDLGNDGTLDLLFSYAGTSEIWAVDSAFTFTKMATTSAGLASEFIPRSGLGNFDVLLRETFQFKVLSSGFSIERQTLTNQSPTATVLGIPRSVHTQSGDTLRVYFSDANGNVNAYQRVANNPFTHLAETHNRYGAGIQNLAEDRQQIITLGSFLADANARDNSYGTRRRFLKRFNLALEQVDSLMFTDRFGVETNSFVGRFANYLAVNVSGDLYVLDSLLTPLGKLENVENYSFAQDGNHVLLSQNGEVRFISLLGTNNVHVNHVRLTQPTADSLYLNFETASTYQKAIVYRSIAGNALERIDSLNFPIQKLVLPLPTQFDSLYYAVELRDGLTRSEIVKSNTIMFRETPTLVSVSHASNKASQLSFDYAMNTESVENGVSLQNGLIESIVPITDRKFTIFYSINAGDMLTLTGLIDREGRIFKDTTITIPYTTEAAAQRIVGYQILSATEVQINFANTLAAVATVMDVDRNQAAKFSQSGKKIVIKREAHFAYNEHYQYEINISGERYFVGFTNSTKIEKTLLFPNPFLPDQHEHLSITQIPPFSTLSIYSFSGQRILKKEFIQGIEHFRLNFQDEIGYIPASGIYFYVIYSDEETERGKFTIVR
jgi:hypothetical protein